MTSVSYDEVPLPKIKKTMFKKIDGTWHDVMFVRLLYDRDLENWCIKHYANKQYYLGAWYKTFGHIIMDEKAYFHYLLCK
jgi:hypothetical protein